MREILFRGKRKCNGEWVYGDLSYHVHDGNVFVFPENGYDSPDRYEVSIETVCQYIGLIDKNGKKIFEGDVIKAGGILMVKWSNKFAGWCLEKKGGYIIIFLGEAYETEDCEVIGNIFDNPELLN